MKIKTGGGGEITRLALISVFQLFFPVCTLPLHTSALLAGISHGQFKTLRERFHSHRSQLHWSMIVSLAVSFFGQKSVTLLKCKRCLDDQTRKKAEETLRLCICRTNG